MAAHLPGYSETPAVAALAGAMAVSILKLPLASVVLALLLTGSAGAATAPIIIVAVVVAYITTQSLSAADRSQVSAPEQTSTDRPAH
jgi:H+/Cl- antiporter ClcA